MYTGIGEDLDLEIIDEEGYKIKVSDYTYKTHLAVVSKIGICRPSFATWPLKTCLITTEKDSKLSEYHDTDSLFKAKSLGKVRKITETADYTFVEYEGNEPLLWIQYNSDTVS